MIRLLVSALLIFSLNSHAMHRVTRATSSLQNSLGNGFSSVRNLSWSYKQSDAAIKKFAAADAKNSRVLVVGAGPAGLAAAERLMRAGAQVTVFEKSASIGGQCQSRQCGDNKKGVYELGAIQIGVGYDTLNAYRRAMKLKLRDNWDQYALTFDAETGEPIYTHLSDYYWPAKDASEIWREAGVMAELLAKFAPYNKMHFVNLPADSEFALSTEALFKKYGLHHFLEDYRVWITSYGYGDLDKVPAFLSMSLINSSYGLIAMRKSGLRLRMLEVGTGGLLNQMVSHYNIDVKTEIKIEFLERDEDGVTAIYTNKNKQTVVENFDYLVIASGIGSLPQLFEDDQMTQQEKNLVANVQVAPYDVVIAKIPALKKGGDVLPDMLYERGHVSLISKNSAEGDEVILYIPRAGTPDQNGRIKRQSESELIKTVKLDLPFDDIEIVEIAYWDNYHEHGNSPRFYRDLNDNQGKNRTIIVGSFARFGIIERGMKHAHDMVEEHILGEPRREGTFVNFVCHSAQSWCDFMTAKGADE